MNTLDNLTKEIQLEEKRKKGKLGFFWKAYYKIQDFFYWLIYFDILEPFRYIKHFTQRGKRGWSDRDTWSFGGYLSRVISEGVDHLRKISCGYPSNVKSSEKWDEILFKISKSYKLIYECLEDDRQLYSERLLKADPELAKKLSMISKEEQKQIDEGKELFKKYVENLWD